MLSKEKSSWRGFLSTQLLGGKALVQIGDVADAAAVQAVADAAIKRFGRIDILVNNAALRREKPFNEMSYAEWREIMDVTLDGVFHCVKACLPALKKSGAGTVINIGGLSAHTGAKNRAHVVTAKAGLIGFTRALAHDLADDGITVNCVVPGLIGTPRPKDKPEPAHHLTHGTISGARGTPGDVAASVRFLCGPGARYRTGRSCEWRGVSGGVAFRVRKSPGHCSRTCECIPIPVPKTSLILLASCPMRGRFLEAILQRTE
jgi:3-oxoacyl-[acyl-carrier protein] reductase